MPPSGQCGEALDAGLTFALSAWGMSSWAWALIAKDFGVRRRIARTADHGLTHLDGDLLCSIVADKCPNLALCAAIAADPRKLAVRACPTGWQLVLLEDGEVEPIPLVRFDDVLVYWLEFSKKYLADVPTLPRAA